MKNLSKVLVGLSIVVLAGCSTINPHTGCDASHQNGLAAFGAITGSLIGNGNDVADAVVGGIIGGAVGTVVDTAHCK